MGPGSYPVVLGIVVIGLALLFFLSGMSVPSRLPAIAWRPLGAVLDAILAFFLTAPLLIGFVLGPMMEENLRRAMLLARGDALSILQRPISGSLLVLAVVLLAWTVWSSLRRKEPRAQAAVG